MRFSNLSISKLHVDVKFTTYLENKMVIEHDKINPNLRELIKQFDLHNRAELIVKYESTYADRNENTGVCSAVKFFDAKHPSKPHVAAVKWYLAGRRSQEHKFSIWARRIKNEKFNAGNSEYHTSETKDMRKALKLMLTYVKPFSFAEIMADHKRDIDRALYNWSSELQDNVNRMHRSVSARDLVAELSQLQKNGVVFTSPTIREFVDQACPIYEEAVRRRNTKVERVGVMITSNGEIETGGVELTMEQQSKLALLRMVDVGANIDEVGMRHTDTEFTLYELMEPPV